MKKIIPLILALITVSNLWAQNAKRKELKVPVITYPSDLSVKNVTTYFVDILNEEDESSGIIGEELQDAVDLQSFTFNNENPDISIFIKGISQKNLNTSTKRSKAQKTYELTISPKESALVRVLSVINGISSHLMEFPLVSRKNSEKIDVPEIITIKFSEQDEYLEFINDDQFKMKPALISKYINQLTEGNLQEEIATYIKSRYDTRIDLEYRSFYYLKDKKNPDLEEATKNSLIAFEKVMADVSNFETLEAKQSVINDFKKFWKEKLDASLAIGKKNKKTSWDLTKNMYEISLLSNNFKQADDDFSQLDALDVRKLSMFTMRGSHQSNMENYNINFDSDNVRQYADAYKVEPYLASINNKTETDDFLNGNDLSKVPGYIITSDGEKIDGKISLRFSPPTPTQGSMVDVSVGSGKSLTLFYVNEKGKDRSKSYKGKNIEKFVVNSKTYESVNPKQNVLSGATDALEVSLNNYYFMELIHTVDDVKLFEDQIKENTFYLKTPDSKKAFPVNTQKNWSKYLGDCPAINNKISDKSFELNKANLIILTDIYNSSCK